MTVLLKENMLIDASITSIFNKIKFHLYPTYRYLQGNCHANAHLASLILHAGGFKHQKIWIFAPCRYDENSKEVFKIYDPNQIAPKTYIHWGFHVAPIIEFEGKKYIFDFNFSEKKPLTISEWLESFNSKNFRCIIEDPRFYLFHTKASPVNEKRQLFDGSFFELEGTSVKNKWLEKGLAANETAYTMYEQVFLNAIKNNASEEYLFDYKLLFGSINNFECVFRDNNTNRFVTTEFKQKHHALIAYYKEVYEANIEKWEMIVKAWKSSI